MNELLLRRRLMIATAQGGGGGLPYDAEIEYLESVGKNNYIDTNFKPNQNTRFVGKIYIDGTAIWCYPFGSFGDSGKLQRFMLEVDSSSVLNTYYGNSINKFNIKANGIHTFDLNKRIHQIDNKSVTFQAKTFQSPYNAIIFGATNYTGTIETYNKTFRFYYFQIYDNGTLIRDYIPVRVGQVGYMYDKVSGNLFGNDGTGNFTIGNDITA